MHKLEAQGGRVQQRRKVLSYRLGSSHKNGKAGAYGHQMKALGDLCSKRHYGTVRLLLGMASRSLHSRYGCKVGDLRLNKTVFHPGWVLTGKIPS